MISAAGPVRSSASSARRTLASMQRPVETILRAKLQSGLSPSHLEVVNESHRHTVPPGSETHFKVVVVSRRFEGLPLLQRHRLVNQAVQEELATTVHALSILAKTPQQWAADPQVSRSPPCLGGSKHHAPRPGTSDPSD